MGIIPKPKSCIVSSETVDLKKINWIFEDSLDIRVINEAHSICNDIKDGFPVEILAGNKSSEAYDIDITENKVLISSEGANGAFYALQTLKQLIAENNGIVNCQKIEDLPAMKYRGFYHDVTRGKVPTLDTLKQLADTMASYKLNSLQLYIEHTFEFKEYEFCRDELGYLTKEEIIELESYCNSKFIELIPSVSSFGHLYHLLENEQYKHLCELQDFVPQKHYWSERMGHHTINPELDESFEVIKSILDQYMQVTKSDKFNICCDETFDLGTGVNKGKNKAELYVNFVKKIVTYLTSKGKTVMMWGDIILQHPEYIDELPKDVIFLNWNYSKNPQEEQFEKFNVCNRTQIVCPGTSSWNSFAEDILIEEGNITGLANYAYKYNALGLLNTNWGDYGNIASLTLSLYGLVLGAAVSWNKDISPDSDFRRNVSLKIFNNPETVELIAKISDIKHILNWAKVVCNIKDSNISETEYKNALSLLCNIKSKVQELSYTTENIKNEVLSAIEGFMIIAVICAKIDGFNINSGIDFNSWCDEYSKLWLLRNKIGELNEVIRVIKERLDI